MAFARWMAAGWGRIARIVAGLILVAVGLYMQSTWGFVMVIIGLVPLTAGVFNFCLFAPLFGAPFNSRRLTPRA
jgi:DUF2892 family protein